MKKMFYSLVVFLNIFVFFPEFSITSSNAVEYRFERLWPKIDQPWYFNEPRGIAITPSGLLFIADTFNHRVQVFNDQGELVSIWGNQGNNDGEFQVPYGIAVSPVDGTVLVSDVQNNVVQAFTQQGNFIGRLSHQFSEPVGIAVSKEGIVYVADRNNHRIQVFDRNGSFLKSWGRQGSGQGEFKFPEGLAISSEGDVLVVDTYNYRIQVFNKQGEFIRSWGGKQGTNNGEFSLPSGITVSDDGLVWVTERVNDQDGGNHRVQVFDKYGNFKRLWGGRGAGQGKFNNPRAIAVNSKGTIFVADGWNHRIQVFDKDTKFQRAWGSEGAGIGEFRFPDGGISISSSGLIFVADTYNDRIQAFDQQGLPMRNWGREGTAESEFDLPKGIVVAKDNGSQEGLVYVTDTNNNRVQVFDQRGKFVRSWGDGETNSAAKMDGPRGIALSNDGLIFIVNQNSQNVQVFNQQGEFIRAWGKKGSGKGEFQEASGVSISPDGEVFIADSANQRIQVFNQQGDFLRTWGQGGTGVGEFNRPDGIYVSETGLVFVVETWNHRIQVFDKQGKFIAFWGNSGSLPGQLFRPGGMTFDKSGNFYVVDSGNRRIQKIAKITNSSAAKYPRKAIILAGGGPATQSYQNLIWDSTVVLTNKAQRILTMQGFAKEEIKYLTAGNTKLDLDGNNAYDDLEAANLPNLKNAIISWASDADNVTIYLADHGGPGKFQVNSTEILDAASLKDWLDQLNNKITGKVSIIIEACRSGAFIPSISAKNRNVLTSADGDQPAVVSNAGMNSFSYYFWSEINSGGNLQTAFKSARQGMSAQLISGKPQNAQLDSNGDSIFNVADYDYLGNYCLGSCITTAATAPDISKVNNTNTLNGETSSSFTMQVNTLESIARAWVTVSRPDYSHDDIDQPVSDLLAIDLNCSSSGLCAGEYNQFDVKGNYQLNFYARDTLGQMAIPLSTQIQQTQGKVLNQPFIPASYDDVTGNVIIQDVQVIDTHFKVVLKQINGLQFRLESAEKLAGAYTENPATYNILDSSLDIPYIVVADKKYRVKLVNTGGFVFQLIDAKEL